MHAPARTLRNRHAGSLYQDTLSLPGKREFIFIFLELSARRSAQTRSNLNGVYPEDCLWVHNNWERERTWSQLDHKFQP